MMRNLAAGLAGLIFGFGLIIAQMINPAKVLAFLDIFGAWDPSLALVMGAGLVVTAIGYRLVWRRSGPVLGGEFALPSASEIDGRLAGGAVLFGAGWGLVGLCPGRPSPFWPLADRRCGSSAPPCSPAWRCSAWSRRQPPRRPERGRRQLARGHRGGGDHGTAHDGRVRGEPALLHLRGRRSLIAAIVRMSSGPSPSTAQLTSIDLS